MPTQAATGAPAPSPSTWTPIVRLDLTTASRDAFADTIATLAASIKAQTEAGTRPPFPFDHDGWYDITPPMSEAALMYSAGNRVYDVTTVKAFATDMAMGDWQPTGETIIASGGLLDEGHHRLLSGLLSEQTFRCYVVTSGQRIPNGFAYLNSGKKRTAADALHIAGLNGVGKALAAAIGQLAIRYDLGILGVAKQRSMKAPNPRDVLKYALAHPDFRDAAQLMLGSFPAAVETIRSKAAAAFFAWLVVRAYDGAVLADFCGPLGTGANLDEDSPILAVRNKLLAPVPPGVRVPDRERLAYVCKAFLMWVNGQRMPRVGRNRTVQPLGLHVDEAFPRIERPVAEDDKAAA